MSREDQGYPFNCCFCREGFEDSNKLHDHLDFLHPSMSTLKLRANPKSVPDIRYSCPYCLKEYGTDEHARQYLGKHMMEHAEGIKNRDLESHAADLTKQLGEWQTESRMWQSRASQYAVAHIAAEEALYMLRRSILPSLFKSVRLAVIALEVGLSEVQRRREKAEKEAFA